MSHSLSIWEKESFVPHDVVIVGAGITGLSTAASLIEKKPELKVLVLERGLLPTGASTRNAGFACFGSLSELQQDRQTLGDAGMMTLVNRRWQGLQKTIARLSSEKIGLETKGGYELLDSSEAHVLHHLDAVNDLLHPLFRQKVFAEATAQLRTFGFGCTQQMILNPLEGQLHSGKLMSALWQYVAERQVRIITGATVSSIEPNAKGLEIITPSIRFQAKAVALCTNAFTPDLFRQPLDIRPGRGMVMLVNPKNPLPFAGTFHYDEGYYYFRDLGGKLLFGGGRNLDFDTETTTTLGINAHIREKLINDLKERILPGDDFEVEMEWSGIMAFGATKKPIVQAAGEGLFLGARLGGMGVAIGSLVGEDLANLILSERF